MKYNELQCRAAVRDSLLKLDLVRIYEATQDVWNRLRDCTLFITGGTGFIGSWLLESLRWANQELGFKIQVHILTRDLASYHQKVPHLANCPEFKFVVGDVRDFTSPAGEFSHIIHAATDSSHAMNQANPKQMYETIIRGTTRVLDFAVEKNCKKVLLFSSGAVYGRQPNDLGRASENWLGSLDLLNPINAYAEGKRGAEMLATIYGEQFGLEVSVARIFALIGPYLPLDTHYAVGNFIKDAIEGKSIIVNGSGLPVRSYLYTSDLAVWLWRLFLDGRPGIPYNIGSENEISLGSLAGLVADTVGNGEFQILGKADVGLNPGRYVPDTTRIRSEFLLSESVQLEQAIRRTASWYGWKGDGTK